MNNSTKERLNDLKRLSVELKDSTQNKSNIDINLIQAILFNTTKKLNNVTSTQEFHQKKQQSKEILPIFKMLLNTSNNSKSQINKSIGYTAASKKYKSNSNSISNQQEQLVYLRQQNIEFEKKVTQMKVQIEKLKEIKNKKEQNIQNEGLPYFKLHEKVQLFLTKLYIHEKDYNKIDYNQSTIILNFDTIIIDKKDKNQKIQLNLLQLKEVHYIEPSILILQFDSDKNEIINLFIKLDNNEELHRWDLSIYINWKITKSSQKEKLFITSAENNNIEEQKSNVKLENFNVEELSKIVKQRRDQYIEAKNKLNEKIVHDMPQQKGKYLLHEGYGKVEDNLDIFPSFQNVEQRETSKFEEINKKEKELKKQIEQKQKLEKIKKQQIELEIQKKQQYDKRLKIALINLKKGYTFTKFSKDGFNPHDKKIYLNDSANNLYWQDATTHKDKKNIQLKDIIHLIYGEIGGGIRKHVKNPQNQFYSIINYKFKNPTKKIMELGSKTKTLMNQFIEQLKLVIDYKNNINNI